MPDPVTGVLGGTAIVGGIMQHGTAGKAAGAQTAAAQAGIDEQRRQFEAIQELLKPWVEAGGTALTGLQPFAQAGAPALAQQQALLGLSGLDAQQKAIQAVEQGGLFQELVGQGEEAILQRAAATGGLRGGNTQAALAQFRPQMLSQAIADQYGRLGGLTALGQTTLQGLASLGQASGAQQAAAGQQTAANIASLLGEQGAARAGGILSKAQAIGGLLNLPGKILGAGGFGGF